MSVNREMKSGLAVRSWQGLALGAVLVFALAGCDSGSPTEPEIAFSLTPEAPTVFTGSSIRLSPSALANNAVPAEPLKWSTSDAATVSVDANGVVRGMKPGSATIRAISSEGDAETLVTVINGGGTIRTGVFNTCGITTTDGLYCWGDNSLGQAGIGSRESPLTTPRKVAGGLTFSSVTLGWEHACGMTATGPYCWGYAGNGQIGDGSRFTDRSTPTKVPGGEIFSRIEASGTVTNLASECSDQICAGHTCALTPAGAMYCWGDGALSPTPLQVDARFLTLSLGYDYTCGIDLAHVAFCWGGAAYRQSSGQITNQNALPELPIRQFFQSISASSDHTCAVSIDGDVYCWGANTNGQLGATSDDQCYTRFVWTPCRSSPVRVPSDFKFLSVSVGAASPLRVDLSPKSHTCGVTTTLQIVCWGSNLSGELGNGSTLDAQSPTPISSSMKFRSVATGWGHTCAVSLDGAAYCWGLNHRGQLGDGTVIKSAVPVRAGGTLVFK
ncbi:MAG: Ig-like domain-containing protein [Gemmatimonadaceae bacterium]|nr:Ig-like domain-containing protein [Gemmatimonadaceae bacterium]